ncbi:MAG TPA: PHP domain-containing protein [Anaerolineae bacterium]|nr:PHP domain-containing protein [Anaerolineae bacterium]
MDMRVDLHLHTTASDGRWPPVQLIDELYHSGIGIFAVTDHDSLGGLAETAEKVRGSGLHFLPGVELSARLNGQLYHLLGYGFEPDNPALIAFVEANNARLLDGSDEAVHLLAAAGYPISLEDYGTYTWDRRRGGWKGLNFLIDRGICRDVQSYFGELFGSELRHPEPEYPSPQEVIEVIREAGGLVMLAHPGAPFYNGLNTQRLDDLVDMGLSGLECYSFHHDEAGTRAFLAYCRSRDLLVTGGSDCHGGFAGRALGVPPVKLSDLRLGEIADRLIT